MRPSLTHYTLGAPRVTGVGLGVPLEELSSGLSGPVAGIVFDDAGTDLVSALLEGLADTDFARENLETLLTDTHQPENWRVGEALAESYLCECRDCYFPWPDGRDERKRGSSLPGADLVGFRVIGGTEYFAFGEVKTSSEAATPPGAAYGRHGLKQQLEDLRDRQDIRNGLVLYLAHRAGNNSWSQRFKDASSVYLRNTNDVHIFGLLIRDVPPHENDLRARVESLTLGCPPATAIELTAIYLPADSIGTLSRRVLASRQAGGAA